MPRLLRYEAATRDDDDAPPPQKSKCGSPALVLALLGGALIVGSVMLDSAADAAPASLASADSTVDTLSPPQPPPIPWHPARADDITAPRTRAADFDSLRHSPPPSPPLASPPPPASSTAAGFMAEHGLVAGSPTPQPPPRSPEVQFWAVSPPPPPARGAAAVALAGGVYRAPPPPPWRPHHCRSHCSRTDIVPLPILGAQSSNERNDPGFCIDGSRMTRCTIKQGKKGTSTWLSVEVPPVPIHSVFLYTYDPAGPDLGSTDSVLGDYSVWASRAFGDVGLDKASPCVLPADPEPRHRGIPVVIECGDAVASHITIVVGDSHKIFLSEVHVYTRANAAALRALPPPAPRREGEVAALINARYEASSAELLMEGGVYVHIYDGFESGREPWQNCYTDCARGPTDTISGSLISRNLPWLFEAETRWGQVGYVTSPDVPILCAYYHDGGVSGHPNGKCPFPPDTGPHKVEHLHQGEPLAKVMRDHFEACVGPISPFSGVHTRNGHW